VGPLIDRCGELRCKSINIFFRPLATTLVYIWYTMRIQFGFRKTSTRWQQRTPKLLRNPPGLARVPFVATSDTQIRKLIDGNLFHEKKFKTGIFVFIYTD